MGRLIGRALGDISSYEGEKEKRQAFQLEQLHSKMLLNEKRKGNHEVVREIIHAIEKFNQEEREIMRKREEIIKNSLLAISEQVNLEDGVNMQTQT